MEDVLLRPLNIQDTINDLQIMQQKRGNEFAYNGIWVFTGSQGSGKTLMLINVLNDIVKAYPNAKIVSNINLYGKDFIPYTGIQDFNLNNGKDGIIYVIDEIQTLFSSIESKGMPPSTLAVWSQNRKNRRVILGTSQRFTRIAKGLREQCTYNIECLSPILSFYRYRVLDGTLYDDNGNYIGEKTFFSLYVPKWHSFFDYNTLQIVGGDTN